MEKKKNRARKKERIYVFLLSSCHIVDDDDDGVVIRGEVTVFEHNGMIFHLTARFCFVLLVEWRIVIELT